MSRATRALKRKIVLDPSTEISVYLQKQKHADISTKLDERVALSEFQASTKSVNAQVHTTPHKLGKCSETVPSDTNSVISEYTIAASEQPLTAKQVQTVLDPKWKPSKLLFREEERRSLLQTILKYLPRQHDY